MPGVVSSLFPPARPAFPALYVAGRRVWESLILARWYAIACGLCVPRARSGCPSGLPRVSFVCVCARALAASAPPLPGLVWRAHLARSRCWPLVGPFPSVRAPPRVLPRSRALFGLLGGRASRSRFPLPGLGLRAPRGVGAGLGTRHKPHRARSCELALRAGWACFRGGTRAPGEGRLPPGCGASGVRRSPTPNHPSFRVCRRGPLPTGCGCGGSGRGDPSPTPQHALLRAGFARCGGGREGAWGGRLLHGCGASGVGRSPASDHSPFQACGRRPLPTGPGCGGCGRGNPSPTPQPALLRAGFAR